MDKKLNLIQSKLKAPKSQHNKFGNYNYRNCEDILEAVKPLLLKHECGLNISDEIVSVMDRVYVKATVTFTGEKETVVTAFARESLDKKGMDSSQITGAASSYARKYALNGLFLIDDTKDADSSNPVKDESKEEFDTSERASDLNIKNIKIMLEETQTDVKKFLEYYKIKSVDELSIKDYNTAVKQLEKKKIAETDKKTTASNKQKLSELV